MAVTQEGWFSRDLTWRMVLFIIVFHGIHIGLFVFGWWKQISDNRLAALNKLTFSVWLSRGAGMALSLDATLLVLPMCKNILRWLRPKVRWLPLDETQWFHRQVAYSLLFWSSIHVSAHYVNFFNVERIQIRPEAAIQIHYNQAAGITGHVMLLCMLLMFTTAHIRIRQQSYETFYYTHHLFIVFLLALYTHATGCFVRDSVQPYSPFAGKPFWSHCIGYQSWRWEIVAGGIYIVERIYRAWSSRQLCQIQRVIRHPYDALEIQFTKPGMAYKPGQWLYLNIPEVSRTQWHPFTITSCPFDPYISVHVRQVGDWTRAVGDALGAGPTQAKEGEELDETGMYEIALRPEQEMPEIRVDGPYGAPAEDVFDNEIAVLIGTGIGVTPWASILKNIFNIRSSPDYQLKKKTMRLKRVEFIWVCKDTKSFEWFHMLLSSLEEQSREEAEAAAFCATSPPDSSADSSPETPAKPYAQSYLPPPTQSTQEFLSIHTYLTQRLDVNAAVNIMLHADAERDPLTMLNSRTNFGRPDFKKFFGAMAQGIHSGNYLPGALDSNVKLLDSKGRPRREERQKEATIGVYVCGPNAAAKQIREACRLTTLQASARYEEGGRRGREVRFRFWKENF